MACERGIDVWVWCDKVETNFPVPYLNNYAILGDQKTMRAILEEYSEGESFPLGKWDRNDRCVYKKCGARYNFHSKIDIGGKVTCPTCLRRNIFEGGWLLDK